VPRNSLTELSPQHLVAVGVSGGEGDPPDTHGFVELLGREQSLLDLRAAAKTELRLDHAKPVIGLQHICGLNEHRWVCHEEVRARHLVQLVLSLLLLLGGLSMLVIHHQSLHECILRG
jgi:hypothetical protein